MLILEHRKLIKFGTPPLLKKTQNYEYKITTGPQKGPVQIRNKKQKLPHLCEALQIQMLATPKYILEPRTDT